MPIYRDDPGTAADEGVSPGEELTIAVGHLGSFRGVRWTSNGDVLNFNEAAFLVAPTSEQMPKQYALYQNYPNPFNPTTSIRYDIAHPGRVEIVIFTVRGEHVRTLVAADQGAGRYTVSWDGKNADGQSVSSGVYFYRLVSSGFSKTCKMVLLR